MQSATTFLTFLAAFGGMFIIHWMLGRHLPGKTAKRFVLSLDATAFIVFLSEFVMKGVLESSQNMATRTAPAELDYTGMLFLMIVLVVSVLLYKVT